MDLKCSDLAAVEFVPREKEEHWNRQKMTQTNFSIERKSYRRIAPQVIAAILKNLLMLDYGLSLSIVAIILPALTISDPNESVQITEIEISWLGSTPFLFKFFGCLFSGWIAEHLGRKRSLLLVNIPFAIAWFILWHSTSLWQIFAGNCVLGIAVGLMKTPAMTYISESCETSVRGVLGLLDGFVTTFGSFLILELALYLEWRFIAFLCLIVPCITIVGILFLPESPMWLLSRNREKDATKSLRWLRGWVTADEVTAELELMRKNQEYSTACPECQKIAQKCSHPPPTMWNRFQELKRQRTLKPGIIILISYGLSQFGGMMQLLPFAVQIIAAYNPPISPKRGAAILSIASIVPTVLLISTVKFFGKRKMYLFSLFGAIMGHIGLSVYGFYVLPNGITSYNSKDIAMDDIPTSYIPIVMFVFLRFCSSNINLIPMTMLGELFPFKTRSLATGVTTGLYFLIVFVANKTFSNIENYVTLPGAFAVYAVMGFLGLIFTYYTLPETERRSNHDIEMHFANNDLGLTDRKIPRSSKANYEQ